MKKLLLVALTLFLGLTSQAQPCRIPGPMKAGKSDIILKQPEGELRTYMRTGGCTDVISNGFFGGLSQEGIAARVVFAPDGQTVYFQNIISRAASGAWVKGTIEGDKILVPYGQLVYWFDEDLNGQKNYGLQLAEVTVKGAISNYTSTTEGNAVFLMNGDNLELQGTHGDPGEVQYVGLGLTYTNQFEGEWSYYLDFNTVYTLVKDEIVTPPEDIATERYSITHGIYGHFVDVAFARGEVYIKGVSEEYTPNAWIKGTLNEETNKITFPRQLAGSYRTSLYYFIGTDLTKVNDNYGGTYTYTLDEENTDLVFDYDPETRSFSSDRALVVNNFKDSLDYFERFPKPVFRPYVEKAGTPAAPAVLQIDDRFWAWGYERSTVAVSIPVCDEEGNFMDPSKLFYSLYVDDDEPYLLYQDEYPDLPFDGVEEIPYLYTDGTNIYPKSVGLWIFQNGFERMGIKSIYYGGDDRRETAIYYKAPDSVGIEEIKNEDLSVKNYYDLSGRRVINPKKGLYIQGGKKVMIK